MYYGERLFSVLFTSLNDIKYISSSVSVVLEGLEGGIVSSRPRHNKDFTAKEVINLLLELNYEISGNELLAECSTFASSDSVFDLSDPDAGMEGFGHMDYEEKEEFFVKTLTMKEWKNSVTGILNVLVQLIQERKI